MIKILKFWDDFKKDFKENKKSYIKWGIRGGIFYTLITSIISIGVGIAGAAGAQINSLVVFAIKLSILLPVILGWLYDFLERAFYPLPEVVGLIYTVASIISQFFVGFCISTLIYYFIRRKNEQ